MKLMDKFYGTYEKAGELNELQMEPKDIREGNLCAVQYIGNSWHRGLILRLPNESHSDVN